MRELQGLYYQAQRIGCGRILGFFGSPGCSRIIGRIDYLEQQMAMGGFQDSAGVQWRRERLRNEIARAGCGTPSAGLGGRSRTICVRLCDGYYFPVSFSANSSRLKTDAAVCQSMYAKEGEAALYIAPADAANIGKAKSLDGKVYADQLFAFVFRKTYDRSCASQLHAGVSALGKRYRGAWLAAQAGRAIAILPVPQRRADRSEDPETLANLRGGLRLGQPAEPQAVASAETLNVRMVGSAYYSDVFNLNKPAPESRLEEAGTDRAKTNGIPIKADGPLGAASSVDASQ